MSKLFIILEVFNEQEKRRSYTKEFKEEAVKLIAEQGYSHAEAGRYLRVKPLRPSLTSRTIDKISPHALFSSKKTEEYERGVNQVRESTFFSGKVISVFESL